MIDLSEFLFMIAKKGLNSFLVPFTICKWRLECFISAINKLLLKVPLEGQVVFLRLRKTLAKVTWEEGGGISVMDNVIIKAPYTAEAASLLQVSPRVEWRKKVACVR